MAKASKVDKWQEKRKRLMQNETYRLIFNRIEGDAAMMHRIQLAITVKRQQPGAAYSPIMVRKAPTLWRSVLGWVGLR